jgi:hypothetical protein
MDTINASGERGVLIRAFMGLPAKNQFIAGVVDVPGHLTRIVKSGTWWGLARGGSDEL